MTAPSPLSIVQDLIRCPSVTPAEGGALDYLQELLTKSGFECRRLPFTESGTPDVDNLYARIGTGAPHLCFAGHTDIVPPGEAQSWSHPPFAGNIADDKLYGRGAADMKGGIGCFASAALSLLHAEPELMAKGSLSFLITGDEEGPAINGTQKMLRWLKDKGEVIDHALVGEPTNSKALGDTIKIGRRGSLNGTLTVTGLQGHVAYPDLAHNPVPFLLSALHALNELKLDQGNEHFIPSNLEITSIDVGNEARNIIPARATARFNIRYNDMHDATSLEQLLQNAIGQTLGDATDDIDGTKGDITWQLDFARSGDSFLTQPGPLTEMLASSVEAITGQRPTLSTGGGTSDARFIKDYCPVIEFGHINATIHQVDEHVSLADIDQLAEIYKTFIRHYFKHFAKS